MSREDKIRAGLDAVYSPSEAVIAKEIQGEFLLIPITQGMVNLEDKLFKLNDTARVLWERLDGKKTLREVTKELSLEYDLSLEVVENDVLVLIEELLMRRMLVAVKRAQA